MRDVDAPLAECVLDASAILAFLHNEPGHDEVEATIVRSVASSVNWSEVVQKSLAHGVDVTGLRADIEALGLHVLPFTPDDSEVAAILWAKSRSLGLSLADRACLALALRRSLPVLTADRTWAGLDLGVKVQLIR